MNLPETDMFLFGLSVHPEYPHQGTASFLNPVEIKHNQPMMIKLKPENHLRIKIVREIGENFFQMLSNKICIINNKTGKTSKLVHTGERGHNSPAFWTIFGLYNIDYVLHKLKLKITRN